MTTESAGDQPAALAPFHRTFGCRPRFLPIRDRNIEPLPVSENRAGPRKEAEVGIFIIVGLGNPGSEYASHRHNIGFQVVDLLARNHHLSFARQKGTKARAAIGQIGDRHVLLAKPQTFMNQSGTAVARLCRAHQVPPERVLVVYDDLDLPLGRLRLRPEGGAGGHRGMRSIIELLATQAFPRLRMGIDRPPGRMDPADYVLQPFAPQEADAVAEMTRCAVSAVECWLDEGIVVAMDRFNQPGPVPVSHSSQESNK